MNPSKEERDNFLFAYSSGITEYRFCGKLGFGGKFRCRREFYVDYYQENKTKERDEMVAKANARLALLNPQ